MAFDPCREWLGIDAVDLADPCRTLGLGPDPHDAGAIGRAAEARLEALGRVAPGPFAKAHAALIAKVEEARDTLLAHAFTAAPMGRAAAAAPPSLEPPAANERSARWPGSPASSEFEPATESPDDEFLAAPRVGRTTPRSRRASNGAGGLLLASLALLAVAAGLIVLLMLRNEPDDRKVALTSGQSGQAKPGPAVVARPQSPVVSPAGVAPPPATESPPVSEPESATEPPPGDGADRQRMAEEQSRREAELAAQQAAATEEARRREEREAADAKQRAEQEQRQMQEALEASLRDAYAALQRVEFDTADRAIATAEKRVGDDVEAATRLERWRLLATYAREFVGYRDQAFAAANAAGRDYTVEGKTIAVIEITPELFIYKMAGRIERVSRERLDPRIELAVVETWFAADGRPANHLFLGAHWLCLDPPNLPRAKAAWRMAGDGGEQVEPLVALLDDPVIRRAAR
jgi:hypothetical protein